MLQLEQFDMPLDLLKLLCLVNTCIYYARQTHEIYHVLP